MLNKFRANAKAVTFIAISIASLKKLLSVVDAVVFNFDVIQIAPTHRGTKSSNS